MKIVVNDQVQLSEFRWSDQPALVQHLHDRDIYDRTLRIPLPYTDAEADDWLVLVARSVPARLRGVRTGEDHRPCLLAQHGISPCPRKERLPGGGVPSQALPQGRPVP